MYTVKWSEDKGITVSSREFTQGWVAIDFLNGLKSLGHVVYGIWEGNKQL